MQNSEYFWKNFRLGSELQIAGTFIYNALYSFDNMESFFYEHECFEFLYNASVGIERLEKIALILLEHNSNFDQNDFEKTLITHSHIDLIGRIKKFKELSLGKTHNKFLQLLTNFYKSSRYDRYNFSSVFHPNQDQKQLVEFIQENLNLEIEYSSFFPTAIDNQIKKFVGKTILRISTTLYDLIRERAYELKTFTYEIVSFSKAYKIFMEQEYSFDKERNLQKEIIVSLINNNKEDGFFKFVETIKPLDFEMYSPNTYINFLINVQKNRYILDELDYLHEEYGFDKERQWSIDAIGASIDFDEMDDDKND